MIDIENNSQLQSQAAMNAIPHRLSMVRPLDASRLPLESRDLIWLAVLGLAARRSVDLHDLPRSLAMLTGQSFQPTSEVISSCVEEMLAGGHVRLVDDATLTLQTTRAGCETLIRLVAQPAGDGVVGIGRRVKLAFLDLLPPGDRLEVLETMIQDLEITVSDLEAQGWRCGRGCYGLAWQAHESAKLRADLAFLRMLASEVTPCSA